MLPVAKMPSVCQRCFQPVPRLARKCPSCRISLERFDPARMSVTAVLGTLIFGLILVSGWLLYRLVQLISDFE
jgi:hypothetical protein